jgi:hypothetical protein
VASVPLLLSGLAGPGAADHHAEPVHRHFFVLQDDGPPKFTILILLFSSSMERCTLSDATGPAMQSLTEYDIADIIQVLVFDASDSR